MDLFKIKTQLGDRDLIPAAEAIAMTAHWYVEHPPELGGEIEQRLQDPFDYAAEDKLIAILQEARERAHAQHPPDRADPAIRRNLICRAIIAIVKPAAPAGTTIPAIRVLIAGRRLSCATLEKRG